MFLKILIVAIFVAVTVAVGVFARKHSNSVDGFVLGGRNVGPWLSAFAFGTSYFSAVVFISIPYLTYYLQSVTRDHARSRAGL